MTPIQRTLIKTAPVWLRSRMLLRLAQRLVHSSYRGSRAISRLRGGTARVDLRASVFCTVREKVPHALCGFYAAAFTRMLALFDIGASTEVVACRGTGEPTCVLNVSLAAGQPAETAPTVTL
jgi:hypothetical protein